MTRRPTRSIVEINNATDKIVQMLVTAITVCFRACMRPASTSADRLRLRESSRYRTIWYLRGHEVAEFRREFSYLLHSVVPRQKLQGKGKERKNIYIAPFVYYVISRAQACITQFYLPIQHACLSFVSVHQMAPPLTEVADIQLQLTTHLSTPKK